LRAVFGSVKVMMSSNSLSALCTLVLLLSGATLAQEIDEIIVVGARDTHTVRTDDTMVAPADTAQLLRQLPGANVNKNGELTGIAQYRGMFGNRMNVSINGARISSGGPNAMDAPLHYAPVALLESLTIHRGITPVSAGQETVGGNVSAETYRGDFTASDKLEIQSRTYFGAQSISGGFVGSGFFAVANRNNIARAFLMKEQADDSGFAGGKIKPSQYERERYDLGFSHARGDHVFSIDLARNKTGDAGTAALPMDIASVDSDLLNAGYAWQSGSLALSARLWLNDIEHGMTNYHLRRPPQDGPMGPGEMRYRRTFAASQSSGFALEGARERGDGLWRFGVDVHAAEHDAVITNPNVAGFFIANFNAAERDVHGVYVEREGEIGSRLGLAAGARYNRVRMRSGAVSADLNPMNTASGMPFMMNATAGVLAERFNAQRLRRTDDNLDWFARLSIRGGNALTWYLGAARKTRSPSYQERYLWLPLESTGGLADGKTYVGDPELEPEVSHEVELGFDLERGKLSVYPRLFYKRVSDFIQGTPAEDELVVAFASMMGAMGMGVPDPLRFSNVEARFHGFDVEASYALSGRVRLRGILNVVRGERADIGDDLYRIAPDNVTLALDYSGAGWMATLEGVSYARQDKISLTNAEQKTGGYSLLNASGGVHLTPSLELVLGINNLFDESYRDHLAGYNRAFNPDLAFGERLPGLGRNVYGRVMWRF
jgi:iron complex outermembrane recepter protein